MNNKQKKRKARVVNLDKVLKKIFPKSKTALEYKNPWELLVAVQLSAQCTDKRVNLVTKNLFKKYRKIEDYVLANENELQMLIKSTGFYRTKAKNILASAKILKEKFGGKVPNTMKDLLTLPGVARKTANVVLSNAFGITEGIAVDTHVIRFVVRYDLSDFIDPVHIEQDLMTLVPKKDWSSFTNRVIEYGRTIAPARPYDISKDPLIKLYPPAGKRFRV